MDLNPETILKESEKLEGQIIEIRRQIHKNPEIAFREFETTEFISSKLTEYGIEHNIGFSDEKLSRSQVKRKEGAFEEEFRPTGVIGYIEGDKGGKTVALRADIDGLPMTETNKGSHLPNKEGFSSKKEGFMHACGHDAHTAILLGVAKILSDHKKAINGEVKLIFQPAEERGEGANLVINGNGIKDVDAIFGLHVWTPLKAGKVMINSGPVMAAADELDIRVEGGGGHGSAPWETEDPLMTSMDIVNHLYRMMNRDIDTRDPAALSICQFNSGTAFNVIPDSAEMKGTIRTFDRDVRRNIITKARKIVKSLSNLNDLLFDFTVEPSLEFPLVNSEEEASFVRETAKKIFDNRDIIQGSPVMAAEDFAYYLDKIPGAFFLLGAGEEQSEKPHHKPNFDIDESVLKRGVALQTLIALNYLEKF